MADFWIKVKRAFVGQPEPEHRPATHEIERGDAAAPDDFFPTAVGCTWDYSIEVSGEPLHFRQIDWPAGNGRIAVDVRGRFAQVLHNRGRRQFQLRMGVVQGAEVPGPLKYPGVELSIEKDDLGVYEDHRKVFWAVSSAQRFEVFEVISYPPDHSSAPRMGSFGSFGGWGDGDSLRPIFFAGRPGVAMGLGKDPADLLAFEGIDSTKAPQWGGSVLHFVRQVKAAEQPGQLSSGFEEHAWYASCKGLVELKQFVGGRETMHWVLRKYQAGSR